MDLNLFITICFGVLSFLWAIYEKSSNIKLTKLLKSESWEFYRNASLLLNYTFDCRENLRHNNNTHAQEKAGSVEGVAQTFFSQSIKNIHRLYGYNHITVDDWIKNNRVHESHRNEFLKFSES